MTELARFAMKYLKLKPKHKDAIIDLYELAADEVEDGESPEEELAKMIADMEEL